MREEPRPDPRRLRRRGTALRSAPGRRRTLSEPVFWTYEDRPDCLVAVELLVRSLERHSPTIPLGVWIPDAPAETLAWLERAPNVVETRTTRIPAEGWDVKPWVLLAALEQGASQVGWIDADIILSADLRPLLDAASDGALVATEEPRLIGTHGSAARTRGWDLPVGREIDRTINVCLMRVGREHTGLVEAWRRLLSTPEYKAHRARPFYERPIHAKGAQDVLTAILGSVEFRDVPIHLLRCGRDVAHCYANIGYTSGDRLRNVFRGLPTLVHAQGPKPWRTRDALSHQLSPYSHVARRYDGLVHGELDWTRPHSPAAVFLEAITLNNPNLKGLAPALFRDAQRTWRRLRSW